MEQEKLVEQEKLAEQIKKLKIVNMDPKYMSIKQREHYGIKKKIE